MNSAGQMIGRDRAVQATAGTGSIASVDWTFVYLMVALKIPLIGLFWIVWWAIHQTDAEPVEGDDGGTKHPPPAPHPHGPLPRTPRRGPHGDPAPPAPARTRTVVARGRTAPRD
jgi:hypothetical protein